MLVVVISDKKEYRKKCSLDYCGGDEINISSEMMSVFDLEQYIYPSLFELNTPTVRAHFLLEENEKDLDDFFIKKLVSSPTVFFFEELFISKDLLKILEKNGAVVHYDKNVGTSVKQKDNLFNLASSIVTSDKKTSWLNYQKSIKDYNIEAILGIVYWKTRDLMIKNPKNVFYKKFYKDLMFAHARAWEKSLPLELLIEKVLLQ